MNARRRTSLSVVALLLGLLIPAARGGLLLGASGHSKPVVIGMIPLLAAPQKYDGKVIRTRGFLNLRFECDSLWLHREDLQASLLKNSFALSLTQKQREEFKSLNHTYVMVQGILHSKGPDNPGLASGTISDITMVHGWLPYVPFAPKKR